MLLSSLALCHALGFRVNSIDDAYITYRYAENLAHGHGYVFNVGERVEGTSTFLFTILLAVAALLRVDIELASRCIGVACFVALVCLVFEHTRKIFGGAFGSWLACGAALLIASSTALAFHAAIGMELLLYTLLLNAGVFGYCCNANNPCQSPHWMLWLALAAATRTEGLFVGIALLVCRGLRGVSMGIRTALRSNATALAWPTLELGAVFLPLSVFRRLYFGTWVPNSVVAKSGFFDQLRALSLIDVMSRISHEQGLSMLVSFSKDRFGYLLVLVPLGLASIRYRRQTATFLLVSAVLAAVVIWNNGDWMPHSRLLAPLLPLAWVAVATSLAVLHNFGTYFRWIAVVTLVIALACLGYGLDRSFYVRTFTSEPNRVANYMLELGRALAATQKGHELLATDMAGRVPYTSRLRTLDMFGLCDRHIAQHGMPMLHMGRIDPSYVYSKRPDFFFYNLTNTVHWMFESHEFLPYANDYWVVTTPFAAKTGNRHGKILLARKDLPRLAELVRHLDAKLVSPQSL